jgi:hypothetical protein
MVSCILVATGSSTSLQNHIATYLPANQLDDRSLNSVVTFLQLVKLAKSVAKSGSLRAKKTGCK